MIILIFYLRYLAKSTLSNFFNNLILLCITGYIEFREELINFIHLKLK